MRRLALAAAGAALLGLTACHDSPAPSAAPQADRTPVSCAHQYRAWAHGGGTDVLQALHGISSAATTSNDQALTAAMKQAKPAVAKAVRHPIPACADPRGYWNVLLMHVNAATGGEAPVASVRAAMQGVPKIHHQLLVEVKQTTPSR
jgi:hypothetical protein